MSVCIQTGSFGVPEFDVRREGTYRPRIAPEQLRALWLLKRKTRMPITKLVAEALDNYLKNWKGGGYQWNGKNSPRRRKSSG